MLHTGIFDNTCTRNHPPFISLVGLCCLYCAPLYSLLHHCSVFSLANDLSSNQSLFSDENDLSVSVSSMDHHILCGIILGRIGHGCSSFLSRGHFDYRIHPVYKDHIEKDEAVPQGRSFVLIQVWHNNLSCIRLHVLSTYCFETTYSLSPLVFIERFARDLSVSVMMPLSAVWRTNALHDQTRLHLLLLPCHFEVKCSYVLISYSMICWYCGVWDSSPGDASDQNFCRMDLLTLNIQLWWK